MVEIKEISIKEIKPNKDRIREHIDEEQLENLAKTYAKQGIIQPIEVDENYQIIVGERRWQACKIAGLKTIPCKIVRGLSQEDKLERALIENIQREDLTELEKAKTIKKLIDMKGWSERSAADHLGISKTYIHNLLALFEVPEEIKEMIKQKKITSSDAAELAKLEPKEAVKIAKQSAKEEKNQRDFIRNKVAEIKRRKEAEKRKEEKRQIEEQLKEINIIVKQGDFRNLIKEVQTNSVDLILTDPPYSKEYLSLWKELAIETERVLKPSGWFITYSGQYHLPEVMNCLGEKLEYVWLAGLNHKGPNRILPNGVINRMKPILVYQKPPKTKLPTFSDLIDSPAPEKEHHEWQQSLEPVKYLIDCFTNPGDLVLDPMAGSGTTALACKLKKRRCITFESDVKAYEEILRRL